jgi:hypothetical protein
MATYYVSPTGSNTSPYDTWVKAAILPNTVLNGINFGAGDILELDGGVAGYTYTDTTTATINIGTNDGGIEIRGSTEAGHDGLVTIDGVTNSILGIYVPTAIDGDVTIRNLRVKAGGGKSAISAYSAHTITLYDLILDGSSSNNAADWLLLFGGGVTLNCHRVHFLDPYGAYTVYSPSSTASTANLNYCFFEGYNPAGGNVYLFYLAGNAGTTINTNNCQYINIRDGISKAQLGSIHHVNDNFAAVGKYLGSYSFNASAGQTISRTTCSYNGSGRESTAEFTGAGTYTKTGNVDKVLRMFKTYPCVPRAVITVDSDNQTFIDDVFAQLDIYGLKGAVVSSSDVLINTLDHAKLVALLANGHELANHSLSHTHLTLTDGMDVGYNGSNSNPRIVIAGTYPALTIAAVTDSGTDVGPLDITSASYDTITKCRLAIDAHADWSTTAIANMQAPAKAKSLKVGTYSAPGSHTMIPLDVDTSYGFWKSECEDSTADIEAAFGAGVVRSLVYPGGMHNNALHAWLWANEATTKFLGARGTTTAEASTDPLNSMLHTSVSIYGVASVYIGDSFGDPDVSSDTEANIRANTRNWMEWCAITGNLSVLTIHETNTTAVKLAYVFDEIAKAKAIGLIGNMTLGDYFAYIRENWTNAGGGTFTHAAYTGDWHLLSTSPCLGAGTDVGLTEDYYGNVVPGTGRTTPCIGIHERGLIPKGSLVGPSCLIE